MWLGDCAADVVADIPAKARRRPTEQKENPIKARGLKKADREVDCFFISFSFYLGIFLRLQV